MTEKKIVAKNSIPIYSLTDGSKHSFFLALYLKRGSIHETEGDSGITHLFEHISIRNINAIMGGELYSTLDRYGIELGASTYSDMVQFYVCAAPENFDIASSILSKILCPIVLDKEEIEAEKKRVKAEIREADEKGSLAGFTSTCVFGNSPMSRPITGTLGSVSRITKSRLEDFRRRAFNSSDLLFFATGCVSDEALSSFAQALGDFPVAKSASSKNEIRLPDSFFKRNNAVFRKNADFCKVRFTFDLDMTKISVPEADLLYDVLLSGYASDLFIEMSERRGIFYDVGGSLERFGSFGTLSFSFETQPKRLCEAVECVVRILHGYKTKALPPEGCMKAGYVTNCYMLLDDPRELNFTFVYDSHLLSLGYKSIDQRRDAYAAITPERIRQLASTVFRAENLTLTLKCPKSGFDKSELCRITEEL